MRLIKGFTLIELMVVMAIVALLLSIAAPRYFKGVDKAREAVLHENLLQTRQALDKYFSDNNKYPDALDELVNKKYLRTLPVDPITGSSDSWIIVAPDNADQGAVFDIRSGAPGMARDGTLYKDW